MPRNNERIAATHDAIRILNRARERVYPTIPKNAIGIWMEGPETRAFEQLSRAAEQLNQQLPYLHITNEEDY